ncbi:MAG: Hpt domain-containing protein [Planctomycetota bacterium]
MERIVETAILDQKALEQLRELDDDGAVLLKIIETFLRDAPNNIATIESAIISNDAKTLDRAAHTLKSTSATLGAMVLSSICKELEMLGRQGDLANAKESVSRVRNEMAAAVAALELETAKILGVRHA